MDNKPQSKTAVFTFGRMNPITIGHKKLINAVKEKANKLHADHHIFLSHTHDSKKNPLTHKQKIEFAHKMVPGTNIHEEPHIKTALDAVKHLHQKGYTSVHMIVGSDRQQEFHNLLHKYNGSKDYHIPHLEVHSAGERDPDAEGVEGMSASKMRDHASKREFSKFRSGVPNKEHAKELYRAVRKGMKLENFQNHFKALFLVGGPGSGKDFIVNSLLIPGKLIELPLDKLTKAIAEQSNLIEFENNPSLIVNGTAENIDKIIISKHVLESMGYDTAMVFVYTSDEESKLRNDERIMKGVKTFSEEVRFEKYETSITNMHEFSSMFKKFLLFDNSNDFLNVTESKKEELNGWLIELGEKVSKFFSFPHTNESAKIWIMENMKKMKDFANKQTHQVAKNLPQPKPIVNGYKRIKQDGVWKLVKEQAGDAEGSPMAKDVSKIRNNYMFPKSDNTGKKSEPKKKRATPPPSFFDSRMGAVPSGGIGLTSISQEFTPDGDLIKEKSFESLRKNISAIISNIDKE